MITAAWREATPAAIHPKIRRPRRRSNHAHTRSTSSRSFPLLPHSRRWRLPRHTAVNDCWTAPLSVFIRVCPSTCIHLSHTGRTRRSAPTTRRPIGKYTYIIDVGGCIVHYDTPSLDEPFVSHLAIITIAYNQSFMITCIMFVIR